MLQWLKTNRYAAMFLLVLRVYVGYEWLTSGFEKLMGTERFNAAPFLKNAIEKPVLVSHTKDVVLYPTYTAFLKNFALPHVDIFNLIVPMGEFLIGLGLILGCFTTLAQFFGLLMNFMFLYAGTISVNPWLIMFGTIILISNPNVGIYGLDRWLMPYLRNHFLSKVKHTPIDPQKHTPAA
jgi:thiosulfate dehydrogenase (quinone) large subunit